MQQILYPILLWSCRLEALLGARGAAGFALLSGAKEAGQEQCLLLIWTALPNSHHLVPF